MRRRGYLGGLPGHYQRVLPVAKEFQEQELIVLPSALIGQALTAQGRPGKAREIFEQIAEPMLELLGVNLESVRCLMYHCVTLAAAGQCKKALAGIERVEKLAKQFTQPYQQANLFMVQGAVGIWMADWPALIRTEERLLELATHASERVFQYVA